MCKVLKCNHLGSIHSSNKIALPLQWCKFRGSLSSKQKCQVILEGSNKELLCRYKVICISYQCYILHIITINPGCTQFFLESSRGHVLCPMFSGAFSTKTPSRTLGPSEVICTCSRSQMLWMFHGGKYH